MSIKDQINADLKQAMLAKDPALVEVLRGVKSALQYFAVETGPDTELSEEQILSVLKKESKKRLEAASLYEKAGDNTRQKKELYEKDVIQKYLPEELSEEEIQKMVETAISEIGSLEQQNMGQVIGKVKQASGGMADGAVIARLVKERLS